MSESCCSGSSSCCGSAAPLKIVSIPSVATTLTAKDRWETVKVRLGIGRMNYKIDPGLYSAGKPNSSSPVLVSSNYKLTFDALRKNLAGLDCWLVILDTKGVNVWCAAGKGLFGTDEVISRIKECGLSNLVTHTKVILPQLGASGVNAQEVRKQTGFSVIFGPVRACDIKEFIASGFTATDQMRTVEFPLRDRAVLTPVELVMAAQKSLLAFGVIFLLGLIAKRPFGAFDLALYSGAVVIGTVITPLLLPLVPGKPFSWKGWLLGALWTALMLWLFGWYASAPILAAGYLLLLPAVSAWFALNFTGSSTYTSPSGVLKEMRIALPLIIGSAAIGAILILLQALFIGGTV